MYIYKIIFGLLDVEPGMFDIKLKSGTSIRLGTYCHAFCIEEIHSRINGRHNFLSVIVAWVWNCLPLNATNFKTIQAFKESLNEIDFSSQLTSKIPSIIITIIINTNTNNCVCACAGICLLDHCGFNIICVKDQEYMQYIIDWLVGNIAYVSM